MRVAQRARETVQRLAGDVGMQRLERRVAALPTEQLVLWAESTLPASGRAFGDWQREGAPQSLAEATLGVASLLLVLEELERRVSDR